MRSEIRSASNFIVNLLRTANALSELDLQLFQHNLESGIISRYMDHWFPDMPNKGSGYRCIRINQTVDPIVIQACAGLNFAFVRSLLPRDLTLWIDPLEVSYRIGEDGSIGVLYEGQKAGPAEVSVAKQRFNLLSSPNYAHINQQSINCRNKYRASAGLFDSGDRGMAFVSS